MVGYDTVGPVLQPVRARFLNFLLIPHLYDRTGCQQPAVSCKQTSNQLSNRSDNRLNVRIHDTAGCQTGFTAGLTTVLNEQGVRMYNPVCSVGTNTLARVFNYFMKYITFCSI